MRSYALRPCSGHTGHTVLHNTVDYHACQLLVLIILEVASLTYFINTRRDAQRALVA